MYFLVSIARRRRNPQTVPKEVNASNQLLPGLSPKYLTTMYQSRNGLRGNETCNGGIDEAYTRKIRGGPVQETAQTPNRYNTNPRPRSENVRLSTAAESEHANRYCCPLEAAGCRKMPQESKIRQHAIVETRKATTRAGECSR